MISGSGALYKARVLHLKGRFFEETGAIAYYQKARPRTRDVMAAEPKIAEACFKLLLDQEVARGRKITPEDNHQLQQEAAIEALLAPDIT